MAHRRNSSLVVSTPPHVNSAAVHAGNDNSQRYHPATAGAATTAKSTRSVTSVLAASALSFSFATVTPPSTKPVPVSASSSVSVPAFLIPSQDSLHGVLGGRCSVLFCYLFRSLRYSPPGTRATDSTAAGLLESVCSIDCLLYLWASCSRCLPFSFTSYRSSTYRDDRLTLTLNDLLLGNPNVQLQRHRRTPLRRQRRLHVHAAARTRIDRLRIQH